jgi:hypothetical protein
MELGEELFDAIRKQQFCMWAIRDDWHGFYIVFFRISSEISGMLNIIALFGWRSKNGTR